MRGPTYTMEMGGRTVVWHNALPGDSTFSFEGLGLVNITQLLRGLCKNRVPYKSALANWGKDNVAGMLKNRDINPATVAWYLAHPEVMGPLNPLLLCELADGTTVVLDGNHQVAALYQRGIYEAHAVIVEEAHLSPFLVTLSIDGKPVAFTRELIQSTFEHGLSRE